MSNPTNTSNARTVTPAQRDTLGDAILAALTASSREGRATYGTAEYDEAVAEQREAAAELWRTFYGLLGSEDA